MNFIYVGYIFILLGVFLRSRHLLMCLLILEGGMLMVLAVLGMEMGSGLVGMLSLIVFSCVSVCEGVMGLVLLVKMVEGSGGDMFYYYGILN